MKKLTLLALALLPAVTFAQEKFIIKGKLGTVKAPAKVFLIYRQGSAQLLDSALLKKGAFEFKGEVKEITPATLVLDATGAGYQKLDRAKAERLSLYLVDGTTNLQSAASLKDAKASGSPINEENQKYEAFLKPAEDASNALDAEYDAASKEKQSSKEFNAYIDRKSDSITRVQSNLDSLYIISNPNTYIALQAVKDMGGPYPDPNRLDMMFGKLAPSVQSSKPGVTFKTYIDGLKAVAVGAMAPDFTQPDTSGKPVSLSSFKGKYVLVDFWASWCGPCRHENPNVVKAFNTYKDKNFTILSVSLDKPGKRDAWLRAIHTDGLAWNHVSDLKFWDNDAAKLYGIRAIPQNLLLDPTGKIIAKNLFGADLENKLAELFGKPL